MTTIFRRFGDKFLGPQLDLRVRLFNTLALAGVIGASVIGLINLLSGVGLVAALVDFAGALLSAGLLYYSYHSQKYQHCYIITIVVIFLGLFPYLFFKMGGYHGGMPAFFIFAVSFTVFMLSGKKALLMAAIEIAVYIGLCIYAYGNPGSITVFPDERGFLISNVVDFTVSAVAISFSMFIHFKLYDEQRRELEKAQHKLLDENAALEHINRLKTEFLGNISHELKTPLTVVSGHAQISRAQLSGEENEAVRDKMRIIASEADRLALMVGQILDVTRIEEGRISIEKSLCHVDELIYSAVEAHFPILNKNDNWLEIKCDVNLPQVNADSARLTQVIVNLISNAVKHAEKGLITVEAMQSGDFVEISICDTGAGIPPAQIPMLFQRFSPGNSQTGTGLGLYICKHIVEQHGGTIKLESQENIGTTVTFTLPIQ